MVVYWTTMVVTERFIHERYNFQKKSSLPDLQYLPEMSFTVGQYIANRYHLTARLGKGSYGEVYKATDVIDLRAKALKTIKDGDANCAEVRSLNALSATNGIQRMFDNFNLNAHLVLVLELYTADLGSISRKQRFSQRLVSKIGYKMVEILKQVHSAGILHRDVKPENVMVAWNGEEAALKLIDWGMSAVFVAPNGQRVRVRDHDYVYAAAPYTSLALSLGLACTEFDDIEMLRNMMMSIRRLFPFNDESPTRQTALKLQFQNHPENVLKGRNKFLLPFAREYVEQKAREVLRYDVLLNCLKRSAKFNENTNFVLHFGRKNRISLQ
ncbi:hypothetical protein B9Z55_028786 [Caenorhabditis nigoni]|uniref:Protein kinase domain-containing protein n=2 Tax=Caenorhabditis nigoni TaxID=1611254 RepID=A0A2G5SAE1_9PELO|nr:hypothetical protein B9Z55_028786 [Caenorhabditis nigoni]